MQNIKTLEQYNKKYRNGRYKLLKYTKKEVADFDKLANNQLIKTKNYLLKGRKWVLIGDSYYEIPRPIRFTWARNVNAGVKALTCCLVGGAAIGGAGYGIYVAVNNKDGIVVDIDASATSIAEIESKELDKDGNFNVIIKSKDEDKEIISVEVKIGNNVLLLNSDYTFDPITKNIKNKYKITIFKETLKKHKGKVVITPKGDTPVPTKSSAVAWATPFEELKGETAQTVSAGATILEIGKISDHPKVLEEFQEFAFKGVDISENKDGSVLFYLGLLKGTTRKEAAYVLSNNKISFEDDDIGTTTPGLFTSFKASSMNFKNIDTSKLTVFNDMFGGCGLVNNLDLSMFDTSKAVSMSNMFNSCLVLEDVNIGGFKLGEDFKIAENMFSNCTKLESIYADDDLDFSKKIETPVIMFDRCENLKGQNGTTVAKIEKTSKEKPTSKYARMDKEGESGLFSKYVPATEINLVYNAKDGIYKNETPIEIKGGSKYVINIDITATPVDLVEILNNDKTESAKELFESASAYHNGQALENLALDTYVLFDSTGKTTFKDGTLKLNFKVHNVSFVYNSFVFYAREK